MNKQHKTQEGQTLLEDGDNYTPLENSIAGAIFQKVKKNSRRTTSGKFY